MVQVYDNCIPLELQNQLFDKLLRKAFSWFYQSDMNHNPDTNSIDYVERPGFVNTIYQEGWEIPNPYFDVLTTNQQFFVEPSKVLQIKATLLPQTNLKVLQDEEHVDMTTPHMTAIYYVCDSDGDTIIYDRMYDDPGSMWTEVQATVTPKKGRLVLFDGKFLHASTRPTTGTKCTISFNFLP